MSLKNLSLSKKLIGAFAAILAITLGLGAFAINRLKAVNATTVELTSHWIPTLINLGEFRTHLTEVRIGVLQHMLTPDKTQVGKWEDVVKASRAEIEKSFKKLESSVDGDEERRQLADLRTNMENYEKLSDVTLGFSRANKMADALANSRGPASEAFNLAGKSLEELVDHNTRGATKAGETSASTYETTTLLMLVAIGGTLVAGFAVAVLSARGVSVPVTEVTRSLAAAGNEIGSASQELTASSQSLANSSARSASALEETSASLREIEKATNENVQRSEGVTKLSEGMRDAAGAGNASMQKLVLAMTDILRANEKIQELVKIIEEIGEKTEVIDEIVFQTKLLSFNASVEAERAGEHGRGFAVVAQEVGNLAAMSGKAALEISAIVKTSVKSAESVAHENRQKVEQGDGLVKETSLVLQQINASVLNVLTSAREILDSSKQQSSAIGQINVAVQQLDRDTQSMSATAEESAAAAAELDAQAGSLNGIVDVLQEMVAGRIADGTRDAGNAHAFSLASNNVTQLRRPQPSSKRGSAFKGTGPAGTSGSSAKANTATRLTGTKAAGAEHDGWEEI